MNKTDFKTKYSQLELLDGEEVIVKGVFVKHDPLPKLKRDDIIYRSGLLLEGDKKPQLFLETPNNEEEQNSLDGKKVVVTGTFFIKQPKKEGDPEFASRYSGSWIYHIKSIQKIQ